MSDCRAYIFGVRLPAKVVCFYARVGSRLAKALSKLGGESVG